MPGGIASVAFSPDGKLLASAGLDGTTRLWDVASGDERVALIDFNDDSSLAITPQGLFVASSARAEGHLNVRVGDRVSGVMPLAARFNRPDLVAIAMAGGPVKGLASAGEPLAPFVQLAPLPKTINQATLTFTVNISDRGGGVGAVRGLC